MKIFLALLLGFFAAVNAAEPVAAKPMAVLFYAPWCLNCKILAPKLEAEKKAFADRVDFVTFDYSDAEATTLTKQKAKDLGLSELYFSNKATGWIALLDGSRQKVGELRVRATPEEIRAALEKLAANPSARL